MTATEIGELLAQQAEAVALHLLPGGKKHGKHWHAGSVAGEAGNSLNVVLSGEKAGMWIDFASDEKGDLIGLWQRAQNCSLSQACKEALDWLKIPDTERSARRTVQRATEPKAPAPRAAPDNRWIELQTQLRKGTYGELMRVADMRGLSTAALEYATRHDHLFFADVHDTGKKHPAWILTDPARHHAQARKMDGTLWEFGGSHKPSKSKTIWGTDSHWPVGIANANTPEIALVEGAPDMLAAWQLIFEAEMIGRRSPVAMFGASTSIAHDALLLFAGKSVFIFPHNDANQAGEKGAKRWADQLLHANAKSVTVRHFTSDGVKDLNDMVLARKNSEQEGVHG